jgi:hypothetical protein
MITSVKMLNDEDINIIVTRNDNVKAGGLIAEICTEPRRYFAVSGLKDRE